jgi:plasmid stabilization system protein ParE
VVFGLRAAVDVSVAVEWYELQREGLGERFLRSLARTIERLRVNPQLGPIVHQPVRRALVQAFPFGVFYSADSIGLVVLAVVHSRRHPDTWPTAGG